MENQHPALKAGPAQPCIYDIALTSPAEVTSNKRDISTI